jgi:hypothetical protein
MARKGCSSSCSLLAHGGGEWVCETVAAGAAWSMRLFPQWLGRGSWWGRSSTVLAGKERKGGFT